MSTRAVLGIGTMAMTVWAAGCGVEPSRLIDRPVRAQGTSTPAAGPALVHALARLEPANGLIAVGSRPGLRIEQLAVAEGDTVEKGQVLARLEGRAQAEAQLAQAEAQRKAAREQRARKREALAVERARVDQIQPVRIEMLKNVYATLATRADDLDKLIKDLEEGKTPEEPRPAAGTPAAAAAIPARLSPKDRSDLKVGLSQLRAESYRAYLALEEAKADEKALPEQRAVEDRQLADGGAEDAVLDQQIALAKANLDALTIQAPASGVVLEVLAHEGEVGTGAAPILYLADVSRMVATAEVDQSDLGRIKVEAPAEVTVLGRTLAGRVTRIGRLVGKNQLLNLDPRAPQDLRIVKVTITLDDAETASRYVNMQVDARIQP